MFCPKCRAEYEPEHTICSDCNVSLVHELPPKPKLQYVEFEEVLATNNPADMALLKSVLEAEDITYFFQGEHVAPYFYHALPVRLMVRKDQTEKAVEILKDLNLSFTAYGSDNLKEDKDEDK